MRIKKAKLAAIFTVLSFAAALISIAYNYLLPMYMLHKLQLNVNEPASIGIIGGADGPTAIYVTSKPSSYIITIIFALLTAIGISYQIFLNKSIKK